MRRISCIGRAVVLLSSLVAGALGQGWDVLASGGERLSADTQNKLRLNFEQRGRYENRTAAGFRHEEDNATGLIRTRLGADYAPFKWLKVSGMIQDSRAPWYGPNAPNTLRDPADLQEGYFELFPESKRGFGMTAGRLMLNYGETRLIGSPQWGNLARTYDHARVYYRLPKARLELLLVSPVKVRIGEFNRPVLGDRVWGMYNVFPNLYRKHQVDAYVLRHEQNRPAGFADGDAAAGTDRLGVNTFGFRTTGPIRAGMRYSTEMAVQTGAVGPAAHRACAFFSGISRRWNLAGKPLDVSAEYKYASGTSDPQDKTRSGTFDQLYPANHDKFGHEDLFGWRNIHNSRSLASMEVTKSMTVNLMYDSFWLASRRDALYSAAGKAVARSASGTAGRHVGQEADLFAVFKFKHFMLGGGYGHFIGGEFIRKTTPGARPIYLYLFHTYGF